VSDEQPPARIERVELDPVQLAKAAGLGRSVVVMPLRHAEGRAIYPESCVTLVKELRAAGIDAAFLDEPERRLFEVKKGDLAAAVVAYVLAIAGAASWDGVKALLHARAAKHLSVTYVDLERPDGSRDIAWKAEGGSAGVLDAIERLRRGGSENREFRRRVRGR
jgi:hypothetical protein